MSKTPQPSRPKDKRPEKNKPPFPKKDKRVEDLVADWPAPNREQCAQLLRILGPHLPDRQRAAA